MVVSRSITSLPATIPRSGQQAGPPKRYCTGDQYPISIHGTTSMSTILIAIPKEVGVVGALGHRGNARKVYTLTTSTGVLLSGWPGGGGAGLMGVGYIGERDHKP